MNHPKPANRRLPGHWGVQENYFETFMPSATVQNDEVGNLPIVLVAKLMKKSKEFVEDGLKQGTCPFGYAVKMKKWSYYISPKRFTEYTGIEVPLNKIAGDQ
ncbi:hypothetical protein [Anaerotruncus colihominis]|uniref:hypothetical protein n=1 Tax=Anaerotruncus colihominis TaxID=169435 RepID=UPI0034A5895F